MLVYLWSASGFEFIDDLANKEWATVGKRKRKGREIEEDSRMETTLEESSESEHDDVEISDDEREIAIGRLKDIKKNKAA